MDLNLPAIQESLSDYTEEGPHFSLRKTTPFVENGLEEGWAKMKAGRWLLLQAWNYEGCSEERAVQIEIRALV